MENNNIPEWAWCMEGEEEASIISESSDLNFFHLSSRFTNQIPRTREEIDCDIQADAWLVSQRLRNIYDKTRSDDAYTLNNCKEESGT